MMNQASTVRKRTTMRFVERSARLAAARLACGNVWRPWAHRSLHNCAKDRRPDEARVQGRPPRTLGCWLDCNERTILVAQRELRDHHSLPGRKTNIDQCWPARANDLPIASAVPP